MTRCIDYFDGSYAFLSNFYPASINYGGLMFKSSEAAYQAQKCTNEEEKYQFCTLDPDQAKTLGRSVDIRPDWEDVKVQVMRDVVRAKFNQYPIFARKLINTGDAILKEGNRWGDEFWGVDLDTGRGRNQLGIVLMQVREELKRTR